MTARGSAVFGGDADEYRYRLTREWAPSEKHVTWIMLNPSTADAAKDDPTIRKCIKLTTAWGYGRLIVVNIFAYRSTDPKALRKVDRPIGDGNDAAIVEACEGAALVVCAWGNHGTLYGRAEAIHKLLPGVQLYVLKLNEKTGQPKHPLYCPDASVPLQWRRSRR